MLKNVASTCESSHALSLDAQAELSERYGLETLMFCPNAWALRHRFINQETGETIQARDCLWATQSRTMAAIGQGIGSDVVSDALKGWQNGGRSGACALGVHALPAV